MVLPRTVLGWTWIALLVLGVRMRAAVSEQTCAAGKVLSEMEDCLLCPPGTFSKAGAYTCIGCAAGTYSNNKSSGASSCTRCPPGTTSDAAATRCYAVCDNPSPNGGCCPAGFFSLPNSAQCLACSPGTISTYGTVSTCTLCAEGEYQPASAASACVPCPSGTSSNRGATFCADKSSSGGSQTEEDTGKRPTLTYEWNFLLYTLKRTIKGAPPTPIQSLHFKPANAGRAVVNLLGCVLAVLGIFSVKFQMEQIPHASLMKKN